MDRPEKKGNNNGILVGGFYYQNIHPPKRKKNNDPINYSQDDDYGFGYNQACNDWEEYCDWQYKMCQDASAKGMKDTLESLPSEEEINQIMNDTWAIDVGNDRVERFKVVAKAINKRLRGKNNNKRGN